MDSFIKNDKNKDNQAHLAPKLGNEKHEQNVPKNKAAKLGNNKPYLTLKVGNGPKQEHKIHSSANPVQSEKK